MKKKNKYIGNLRIMLLLTFVAPAIFFSCEEEDPFVDRTTAPVLLVFDEVQGYLASGGLTSVPSVTKTVTSANYTTPVLLSLTAYELDKSGLLKHTIGIDSIPVAGLQIVFSKRDGTAPVTIESDTDGKVVVSTTWEALGITDVQSIAAASAAKTITIPLLWTGAYKGQSFARYSQVVFTKPSS